MIKKHIGFRNTNGEQRKVFILQPYLDDDTSSTIVVDVDSLPMHYKTQLENFVDSITAQQSPRLIDFLQHESFNDGTNILQYVHRNSHIEKVKASELILSTDGYAHNTIPYGDVLKHILEYDGKAAASESKEEVKKEEVLVEDVTVSKETAKTNTVSTSSTGSLVTKIEDGNTVTFVLDKSSVESVKELGKAYSELKNKTMEYLDVLRQEQVDVYNIIKGGDSEVLETIANILGVQAMPLRKSLSNLRNIPMDAEEQKTKRGRAKAKDV
jgi:hypothetical protein